MGEMYDKQLIASYKSDWEGSKNTILAAVATVRLFLTTVTTADKPNLKVYKVAFTNSIKNLKKAFAQDETCIQGELADFLKFLDEQIETIDRMFLEKENSL